MSSADWEEVKRLAADFQRAQLASTLQKLSERNCVELINKLVELKLIDVHYTTDGKEYITPQQLTREIKDELFVHGGRINLVDLGSLLNIDLTVVEVRVSELVHSDNNLHLVVGQLISSQYLDTIAEEVNERLQQEGATTIADLAKHYDLPGDFMLETIIARLETIIQGQQDDYDSRTIFTDAFVAQHRARVRGALSAITRPTPVSGIIQQYGFKERLFFSMVDKLVTLGRLPGTLTGGRQANKAVYVPNIYSKTQSEWVDTFLRQNGYLEFEGLRRLGIGDPDNYIKRRFKDQELTYIGNICVGPGLIDQIDAAIDDALLTGGWVDIYPLLPTVFSPENGSQLVTLALKNRENKKSTESARVFNDTVVISDQLVTKISTELQQLMPAKAKQLVDQGAFKQQLNSGKALMEENGKGKKDDRRKKAAGGKAGGGTQGRETKTKATKNKYKGRKGAQDSDSEGEEVSSASSAAPGKLPHVEFMSEEQLQQELSKVEELSDCPEELIEELTSHLHHGLTREFQGVAQSVFLSSMSGGGGSRRKTHQQLQEKVQALLTTAKLSEKSIKLFNEDQQILLKKHLLKTHCTELVNELVLYLADDSLIDMASNKQMTTELRQKIIQKLSDDCKGPIQIVHKTLNGSDMDEFFTAVDDAIAAADIMLKKKDNKKDKNVLQCHRASLIEQLSGALDFPLTLHIASLVLFHTATGNMLSASGKFVPHICAYLRPHLSQQQNLVLSEYQDLVIKSLTQKDPDSQSEVISRLEELTPQVKEIAITYKKSQGGQTQEE